MITQESLRNASESLSSNWGSQMKIQTQQKSLVIGWKWPIGPSLPVPIASVTSDPGASLGINAYLDSHTHSTHSLAPSDWLLFAEPPKFCPNQSWRVLQSSSFLMQTQLAALSINTKIFRCLDYTVRMTNTCSSKEGENQKYLCAYLFKQGLAIILLGGLAG